MEILKIDPVYQQGPLVHFNLSFRPYARALEAYLQDCGTKGHKEFYESILRIINADPVLSGPVTALDTLAQHKDLLELMRLNLFPEFPRDPNREYALGILSPVRFFTYSGGFKDLMFHEDGTLRVRPYDEIVMKEENSRMMYREILKKCYGVEGLDSYDSQTIFRTASDSSITAYYRFNINKQFMDVRAEADLPPLQQEWIDYATDVVQHISELRQPLPLDRFVMEGFFVFTLHDVTEEQALHELKETVANMHTQPELQAIQQLKKNTLSYLGNESLELGIIPFIKLNREYLFDEEMIAMSSVVFRKLRSFYSKEELAEIFNRLAEEAQDELKYTIYSDTCEKGKDSDIGRQLAASGLYSMAIFPIWHQEKLLGLVELGGTSPGAINGAVIKRMDRAVPMYREFLIYQIGQVSEHMEAFIKQRYTAIQPAVSWKFYEAARYALKAGKGRTVDEVPTPPIRFNNLHPFYGAVDIRNSSVERLQAVRSDYSTHLHHLVHLLKTVSDVGEKPVINDLLLQIRYWQALIADSFTIEQEADLRQYLEEDMLKYVQNLGVRGLLPEAVVAEYSVHATDEHSIFYTFRNNYESSLQMVNRALKDVLEPAAQELLKTVPHYFEKFKTDGWEYNLYAGKSIAPWQSFDPDAVAKVQRWQLLSMIDMARAIHRLQPDLQHPMNTTQLILAHMQLVNINYRVDERRFDVEGAYSIRYEVIKKRIDKAHVLDTGERLTQPGTIAIVYAHSREAVAYRQQLQDLIKEGYLQPDITYMELEKLQGVSGLKAMRVTINMDHQNNTARPDAAHAIL